MIKKLRLLAVLLLLVSCASAAHRPSGVAAPQMDARLVGSIFFGTNTTAPATFEVSVRNPSDVPLTLQRIRIDSPGMSQYTLSNVQKEIRETIDPGETGTFTVFGTAVSRVGRASEPLTIRLIADFEAEGKSFREVRNSLTVAGP